MASPDDAKKPDEPQERVAKAAKAEKALLKAEHSATERVIRAKNKLERERLRFEKAQARFNFRMHELDEACEKLRAAQYARIAGPVESRAGRSDHD